MHCETAPTVLEIVVIPAGSFEMGSDFDEMDAESNEEPRHKVTMAEPIGVGKFEITVEEFRRFIEFDRISSLCSLLYQAHRRWRRGGLGEVRIWMEQARVSRV